MQLQELMARDPTAFHSFQPGEDARREAYRDRLRAVAHILTFSPKRAALESFAAQVSALATAFYLRS